MLLPVGHQQQSILAVASGDIPYARSRHELSGSGEQQQSSLLTVVLAERNRGHTFVFPLRREIDVAVQPAVDRDQVMCGRQRTVALSDRKQPVLAHVPGHTDATENATQHVLGLVRVDSAVAVKSENAGHLPAAAEFAAMRKSGGIEIGGILGKAQRVEEVRPGANPPLSADSQYAHQHFHYQAPTEVRFCFSSV